MSYKGLVSLATRLLAEQSWLRTPEGVKYFSVRQKHPDLLWGPHTLVFNEYRSSYPGIKQPRREVGHSHLLPELRMSGAVPLLPLYAFMA
jgi:hypothetical protein